MSLLLIFFLEPNVRFPLEVDEDTLELEAYDFDLRNIEVSLSPRGTAGTRNDVGILAVLPDLRADAILFKLVDKVSNYKSSQKFYSFTDCGMWIVDTSVRSMRSIP